MGDVIEIQFGGDLGDFVTSATTATNAVIKLGKETEKVKRTQDQHAQATDKAARTQNRNTTAMKGASRQTSNLDKALKKAGSTVKTFIAGWAGIAGVQKALSMVKAEIQSIAQAQRQLAQGGATMDQAAKQVMNQLGGGATMKDAEARLKEIMKSGRLSSVGQAQGISIAGNVAWGGLGAKKERSLVRIASEFIGRKGLGEAEGGSLIEILGKMGATNESDVKQRMEQIFGSFRKSQATSFSGYVTGLKKLAPEMKAAGATPEQILSTMTRARDVKATEEESAELGRQINMAMNKEVVQKAVAKERGMKREEWIGQGFDKKQTQFGQWVAKYGKTAKGQMLLGDILPGRELGRTMAMFSPEGMQRMGEYRAGVTGIGAGVYDTESAAYAESGIAKREAIRSSTALGGLDVTPKLRMGGEILAAAKRNVERIKSYERTDIFSPEEEDYLRDKYYLYSSENEIGNTAKWMMNKQLQPFYQEAAQRGAIKSTGWKRQTGGYSTPTYEAFTEEGEKLIQITEAINNASSGFWGGVKSADYGRIDEMLEELREIKENLQNRAPVNQ